MKKVETIYAFETWPGGISDLYEASQADAFIDAHYQSGTFAELHICNDKNDALRKYEMHQEFILGSQTS